MGAYNSDEDLRLELIKLIFSSNDDSLTGQTVQIGVEIIGGDTGSYVSDVFAATAIGKVKTEEALLRKKVQDGDLLCVTGVTGRPITALIYFTKVKSKAFQLSIEEEKKSYLPCGDPLLVW